MPAVLFDLDRTLVDVQSFTDYAAALTDVESLIAEWEDPPTPPTGWDGPTLRAMGVLVALSGDPRWQEVSDAIEAHELAAVERSVAMAGVGEALHVVDGYPVAVVTLLPAGAAQAALRRHGISLEPIVARRADLRPKPAPDQLLEACRLLGVSPAEATMVGDSTWDEAAARTAGITFVGVTNGGPSEFPAGVPTIKTLAELSNVLT